MGDKIKFVVSSRRLAKEKTFDQPWAAIQVATYDDWPNLNKVKNVGILRLTFSDANGKSDRDVPMVASDDDIVLFNEKQANCILDFFENVQNKIEVLLVHCEAGVSRSPAIAAALSKLYYGDDTRFFANYTPNSFVYNSIIKAYNKRNS